MRDEIWSAVQNSITEHVKAAMNPLFLLPDEATMTPIAVVAQAEDISAEDGASRKRKISDSINTIASLDRDYQKEVSAAKAKKEKVALIVGAVAEAKGKITSIRKWCATWSGNGSW